MQRLKWVPWAIPLLLPLAAAGLAQNLRVSVDLVLLDVSVHDQSGHSVRNLTPDNIKVYEDKIEQPIAYFSSEESPVTWGIVVDRSGSMTNMKDVHEAAVHMLHEGVTQDETFVMTFSRRVDTLSALTSDRRALHNALFGLYSGGATALYDAVGTALDQIKAGTHRRKALIVITDGADNKSVITFKRLLNRVRESDVLVYTVGMNTASGVFAKGRADRSQLEELAEVTGGFAHFPTNLEKCAEMMSEIAREVSAHYTIGYYPANSAYDGKWRKIRVAASGPNPAREKLVARTRTGYFAMGREK